MHALSHDQVIAAGNRFIRTALHAENVTRGAVWMHYNLVCLAVFERAQKGHVSTVLIVKCYRRNAKQKTPVAGLPSSTSNEHRSI